MTLPIIRFVGVRVYLALLVCIGAALSFDCDAQDTLPSPKKPAIAPRIPLWIGFGGGINYLQFSTDGNLRCLGDPACPVYNGAGIFTPLFGGSFDWRLSGSLGLLLRANYNLANVSLTAEDNRAKTFDGSGNIVPLVRRHSLEISAPHISFDILADIILDNIRFFGGGNATFLFAPKWSSNSTILSPGNVTFGNNRRDTLFLPETKITDASSYQPGITAGFGYDFYLNQKLILTPEVCGTLPLSSIIKVGNLKKSSVALSLSLRFGSGLVKTEVKRFQRLFDTVTIQNPTFAGTRFSFGKNIMQIDVNETDDTRIITETTMRRDTVTVGTKKVVEPPKPIDPTASFSVYGINGNEAKSPLTEFLVRGRFVTEAFPLLPMLFFENNSSTPAKRYHLLASSEGFSEDKLPPHVLDQHKEILNIIGKRMSDNPKTEITLRGTADETTENADCHLAESRARYVKDYLSTVWGVAESRIKLARLRRKCEPESPTTSQVEAGYAENRRVEIESDDDETLLAPVLRAKYIELSSAVPEKFEIDPSASIVDKFQSWELSVKYKKAIIATEIGKGAPISKQITLPYDIARSMHTDEAGTVDIAMLITDGNGKTANHEIEIPVKRDTVRQAIARLSLMHFQVLKDKLNRAAKAAIKRFISDLGDDATVSVVGYTDNLGDQELNSRLSSRRAEEVTNYIKFLKPSVKITRNEGVASTKYPPGITSHELPESRILSRTVQIEIIRNWW